MEAYYVDRTRLELIAERKVRRRQLTNDGNVEITGRDLHGRGSRPRVHPITYRAERMMRVAQQAIFWARRSPKRV
jgi:hypothetical protein